MFAFNKVYIKICCKTNLVLKLQVANEVLNTQIQVPSEVVNTQVLVT